MQNQYEIESLLIFHEKFQLGNCLTVLSQWLYSYRLPNVVRLSVCATDRLINIHDFIGNVKLCVP